MGTHVDLQEPPTQAAETFRAFYAEHKDAVYGFLLRLLGDPAECMAMLANHLGKHGQKLEAGWIVLAGAATDARPLADGTIATARYSHLGPVTVKARA